MPDSSTPPRHAFLRYARSFFVLFLFLLAGVMSAPNPAAAQVSVSPLTFELTANPGETVRNAIRVSNPSGASIIFEMEVEDFTAAGEEGQVIVSELGDETYSMKKWIAVDPYRFIVGPGESQVVNFSVTVPERAEPGGHYASILATVKGTAGDAGSAVGVSQKVGALVLLSVAGKIREELYIREFSVPAFSEQGPIAFTIRFDNVGSVHLRPLGLVAIADFRGNKVAEISFPQRNVLPGSTRKISVTWDKRFPIGKFTATLVGSFGISNTPISAVTAFWVFPWKLALEILGGLLVLLFILIKTRRRFSVAFRVLFRGEHTS